MTDHPDVAKAAGFNAEAVVEDLDNVEVIKPFSERVDELRQRIADSRLTWLAEAWSPSLVAYGVAKAASDANPALRTVTTPLGKIFVTRRRRAEAPAETPTE